MYFLTHFVYSFRMIRIKNFVFFAIQHLVRLSGKGVCTLRDGNSFLMLNLEKIVSLNGQCISKIQ